MQSSFKSVFADSEAYPSQPGALPADAIERPRPHAESRGQLSPESKSLVSQLGPVK